MPLPTRHRPLAAVLAVVLALSGVLVAALAPAGADGAGRTWVVDAVDDEWGNRWESVDTGTPEVTIRVGDTVEWQWDRARQGHDLTSLDTRSTWAVPLQAYGAQDSPAVSRTFTEPGIYEYICSLHGTVMRGTVVVEAADANLAPTAEPDVAPRTGAAPLVAHFTANGSDPDGDELSYLWDFGTSDPDDRATSDHAMFEYTTPGDYVARLEVSDSRGGRFEEEFAITVTAGGPDPEPGGGDPSGALPAVAATATPGAGSAPLGVAFSAEVTTSGAFHAYSHGLTTRPDLAGSGSLVRRRGATTASLEVAGVEPGAHHPVHVHEQACSDNSAGAHFRFDETQPFSAANEIWPAFTATSSGASGPVAVTQPLRAGPKAVSMVIHDPANPGLRIGCVDLAPSTADLTYTWDFGDGSTGTGPDPDHTYAAAGTYTATVTLAHTAATGHDHAQAAATAAASVQVTVQSATPGPPSDTAAPQTVIADGPAGTVRGRRATFALASEAGARFECRIDRGPWVACASGVTYGRLRDGRHELEVRALDAAGNTDASPASQRWTVDRSAPVVRRLRPNAAIRDRTPTVRAAIRDAFSPVRRKDVVLTVDGRRSTGVRFTARGGRLVWTPPRELSPGRHTVRLVVSDTLGNRRALSWTFAVRR